MMAHATMRGSRPGRALTLLIGFLVGGGLLIQWHDTAFAEPAKTAPPAEPAKTVITGTKDQSVAEMVQLINERLATQWAENKIKPSEPASDYDFIRRVSLDIIGRIAKPEEISKFLSDPPASRRALLIERLLVSDEYPRNWANMWTNWLLTRAGTFGRGMYHDQMHVWLEDQFAQFRPFNQIVSDLITATGDNTKNGAVNFILAHLGEMSPAAKKGEEGEFEMVPITSRTTKLFLGIQTQCTQCHDHPFDARLKQNHFWGINAFYRQVERKGRLAMRRQDTPGPLELADNTSNNPDGFVYYEKRNGVVLQTKPVFLDGTKLTDVKGTRRQELARLITEHDNFPKAFVNRMWAHFLGRGFTSPVDDFNEQNQPSNPTA